jgi:SPP1 family predicted phage head-tail adaptor
MIVSRKSTASRLRHRLTLQQEVQTPDGAGGSQRTWENVADLWAEINTVIHKFGDEKLVAGQMQSAITHKITLRYRTGITTGMRFVYDERAFNIRNIMNVQENNEILELLVEELG